MTSGQLVSPQKLRVFFGRQASLELKHYFMHTFHFSEGSLLISYLGVPLFLERPKMAHLQPIADKIISKFDRWNGALLSLAGRLCLINSVVTSSLTHSMMVYRWLRKLLKSVDTTMRNFLWNGNIAVSNRNTLSLLSS